MDESKSSFNIYVGSLSDDIQDLDLALFFQSFGEIKLSRVIRDPVTGYTKGYGFVNFATEEAQLKAIAQEHVNIKGHKCFVKKQHRKGAADVDTATEQVRDEDAKRTLYVRNFPATYTDDQLKAKFEALTGPIARLRVHPDFCFLTFADFQTAERAMAQIRGVQMDGQTLMVQFSKSRREKDAENSPGLRKEKAQRTLFVRGLVDTVTEESLRSKFGMYGETKRITLVRSPEGEFKGYGFVEFANKLDANEASRVLDGTEMDGRTLTVQISNAERGPVAQQQAYAPAPAFAPTPAFAASPYGMPGGGGGGAPGAYGAQRLPAGGMAPQQVVPIAPPNYTPYQPYANPGGPPPVCAYDERTGQYVLVEASPEPPRGQPTQSYQDERSSQRYTPY